MMKGIKISNDSVCDFEYFFKPILHAMGSYHWVWQYESEPCYPETMPEQERLEYLRILRESTTGHSNCIYTGPNLILPKFAPYIHNDWSDLYGFSHDVDVEDFLSNLDGAQEQDTLELTMSIEQLPFEEQAAAYEKFLKSDKKAQYGYLEEVLDCCFFNVDGTFWAFFSREESLLNKVKKYLRELSREIVIEDVLLENWTS